MAKCSAFCPGPQRGEALTGGEEDEEGGVAFGEGGEVKERLYLG
jgi:hypothetical protein